MDLDCFTINFIIDALPSDSAPRCSPRSLESCHLPRALWAGPARSSPLVTLSLLWSSQVVELFLRAALQWHFLCELRAFRFLTRWLGSDLWSYWRLVTRNGSFRQKLSESAFEEQVWWYTPSVSCETITTFHIIDKYTYLKYENRNREGDSIIFSCVTAWTMTKA